ncbi:MAG: hypothetical protein KBB55_00435 [Candidatus Buchananbacteria bacterium]|nr:hypothetical protein [Candidatus Buchananbacteria bacterium]
MKQALRLGLVILTLAATIRAEVVTSPAYKAWDPTLVTYDAERGVYVDHYKIPNDNWIAAGAAFAPPGFTQKIIKHHDEPRDIPAKHSLNLSLRTDLWRENKEVALAGIVFTAKPKQKSRFVLINVEQAINEIVNDDTTRYRTWPHLGLLFVGTAAAEEGYEVVLWDELVQGYTPLEQLIKPGDIVGLSLVVTGIERGARLAEQAKRLGARYVIAGNDSAMFRANQLLSLPGKPIDAVFTSNSLNAVREFFYQITQQPLAGLSIPGVQLSPGAVQLSNERSQLIIELAQLARERKADPERFERDAFLVPRFDLFPASYRETVWQNYRQTYGHKFENPAAVKNATGLLAQGCTRTRGKDVCLYCSDARVGDIRIPKYRYLADTVEMYHAEGINTFYNVTDSVYEMAPAVAQVLKGRVEPFTALTIYGRAQGVAQHPQLLDDWLSLTTERLTINMGQDSGDEQILSGSIGKSSATTGSRVDENRLAVEYIKRSGANLHGSFIFGSPGETRETCERTLEYAIWVAQTLGRQCETLESDVFWLNFGSPAAQVFHDYEYATELAGIAGKTISVTDWQHDFWEQRNQLAVPMETEKAWYQHFTHITYEEAREYVAKIDGLMSTVPGSIAARGFNPGAKDKFV